MKLNSSWIILKIIPIMFILLISGLGLPTVFAASQTTIGDDLFITGTYTGTAGRYIKKNSPPQDRILKHSSGKTLIVRSSYTLDKHAFVTVVSSTGIILANIDLWSVYSSFGSDALLGGMSIAELSSTEAIILLSSLYSGNCYLWFIVFNINTYSATGTSKLKGASIEEISELWYYSGCFYALIVIYSPTPVYQYYMIRYNISTKVITELASTTYIHSYNAISYGFLDSTNALIYFFTTNSANTIEYFVFNIGAGTITSLCVNPTTGHYPDENQFRYGYGNFINYYGGGILTSGTYLYLYHSWSWSYRTGAAYPGGSGVRYVETVFWYSKFNNSISSGTLLEQHCIYDSKSDTSLSTSSICGLSWGYTYHIITANTFTMYTYYQDIYAGKNISRVTYYITDITSDPIAFTSIDIIQGMDNIDWKYISSDAQLGKDIIHGISYHMVTSANTYLVIGDPIFGKIYTFSDSYAPADDPLLTNKNYVMTYNIYVNGVADDYNETAKIFVDGVERITKSIPSSGSNVGKITFNMMIGTAGIHSIILKIYNNAGVYEALSDEYLYTFIASTTPTGDVPSAPTLIGFYSDIFMLWLPIGIIVFLPLVACTMLGAKYAGGAGAITGMIFGGATGMIGGTVTGIIPTYALYLLVILIATAIVVLFVRGSSGGGSAEP